MKSDIKAVFLDLGGTFRIVDETNMPYIRQARERICELCGADMEPDAFYGFLNDRYDGGTGHSRRFEDIQKAIHASGSSSLAAASG